MPHEILKRLAGLAGKSQSFEVVAKDTGGWTISPHEIAGMLAHLPRGPYSLALVKYALDLSAFHVLEEELMAQSLLCAREEHWDEEISKRFPVGLFYDLELIPDHCKRCRGHGEMIHRNGTFEICPICGGDGRRQISERRRSQYCQIDHRSWRRTWARRYRIVLASVLEWESVVVVKLIRELRVRT